MLSHFCLLIHSPAFPFLTMDLHRFVRTAHFNWIRCINAMQYKNSDHWFLGRIKYTKCYCPFQYEILVNSIASKSFHFPPFIKIIHSFHSNPSNDDDDWKSLRVFKTVWTIQRKCRRTRSCSVCWMKGKCQWKINRMNWKVLAILPKCFTHLTLDSLN